MPIGLGSPISNEPCRKPASRVVAAFLVVSTFTASGFAVHRISLPARTAETSSETQEENEARQKKFLEDFRRLPPQERIRVWKLSDASRDEGTLAYGLQGAMNSLLVAEGMDTVPELAAIVRNKRESLVHRKQAIRLLAAMDMYVPLEDISIPVLSADVRVKQLGIAGVLNGFRGVTGQRIGREGYEVLIWAANQAENNVLRFHALSKGFLHRSLKDLTLEQQLARWREAVTKTKGQTIGHGIPRFPDEHLASGLLLFILAERGSESVPVVTDILETDNDPYVREAAVDLLARSDLCAQRLRGTTAGRRAIDVIQRTLEEKNLKPFQTSRAKRMQLWETLSAQFLRDEFELRESPVQIYALALEMLYGEKVNKPLGRGLPGNIEPVPEMREFFTYLTELDPNFPSWEYSYCGGAPAEQVLHPKFRAKTARLYDQWVQFKASRQVRTGHGRER